MKVDWNNSRFLIKLAIACLLILSSAQIFAQIDNSDFKVELAPEDLGVCGDNSHDYVTVTAKKNSLSNFEIVMDLPDGVDYVASTELITGGASGYTLSQVSIADLNRPRFSISNGGNWSIGDQVTFRFERTAGCEAVQFKNNNSGVFKDAQEIYYTDAGVSDSDTDFSLSIYTYNLLDPSISIQSIPTLNTFVGDNPSRDVEVEQGGQGCLEEFEYFVTVQTGIGSYQLSYLGMNLSPSSTAPAPTGDTLFYQFDLSAAPFFGTIGNGDVCWENGEVILFTEDFEILSCDGVEIRHHAFWGCSSDECQVAAPQSGGISFGAGVPDITITELDAVTIDLCDVITYTVLIENSSTSGVTPAFDLSVIYGEGANSTPISTPLAQTLWGMTRFGTRNWENFALNGIPITESTIDNGAWADSWGDPSWIPYDYFTSDPDGPTGFDDLDGDGYYDDLAPGESVTVTFDFFTTPRDNCGTGRYDYLGWEHNYFDVSFFDQCGDIRPDPKRIDFDYKNFIRDYQTASTFEAPSDIDDGVDFNVMIKPYLYSNSVQCHGANSLTGAFASWDVRIFVPTGVSLSSSDAIDPYFSTYSPTKTVIPGVGGDTIVYALNRYDFDEYNFLLNLDCAAYQAAGGGQTLTIPYETTYYCSDGTDDCWVQKIHCGQLSMTTHCIGGCKGPSTISFDAQRTTPGYTDDTRTTLVTLDPAIHELDNYNAADTMVIYTDALIVDSALSSLFIDIDYTANSAGGGQGIIEFVSGEMTIDDVSSGSYSGSMNATPVLSSVGNNHTATFDISSYTSLVSPTYQYGEGDERDTVHLALKFVFSKNFNDQTLHELQNFSGRHYAVHPTTLDEVACDSYGDRAYYHKVRVQASAAISSTSACTPRRNTAYHSRRSATGDLHPGEYRPPVTWDSTLVVIPEGTTFSGRVDLYDLYWYYNITSFTVSGDSVWIYPPPGYADVDQRSTYYPRVRVETYGNCEAETSEIWASRFYHTAYSYHPNPAVHEAVYQEVNGSQFNYTPPTFILQSPTPNENGFATSVSWDVELCNNATTSIGYNWFRVAEDPNIQLDSIVNTAVGTALNVVNVGGYDYVELGDLGDTPTCNFYEVFASYSTCEFDTLRLDHGWDCVSYPTDYDDKGEDCYDDMLELVVEPQLAQIQMGITDEPTMALPLCNSFTIGVEFISAQISDAVAPYMEFAVPGGTSGLIIDSVQVEYPRSSGNIETLPFSVVLELGTVDLLDHSVIGAQGAIYGTENASMSVERFADITLYYQLGCDFPSGTSLDYTPYAQSPCGDQAIGSGGVTTSGALFVDGAVSPYDAFTSIDVPDMEYCGSSTVNFQTTIVGGTTGSADSMQVNLPYGLTYLTSSLTCIGSNCPTGVLSDTDLGYQRLYINFPSSVSDGEVIEFEIDVAHDAAYCDPSASISVLTYFSNSGLACASSTCDATPIPTGTSAESFNLAKPALELVSSAASMGVQPDGEGYYDIEFELTNTGIDALVNYDYNLYCSDGAGDISGPAIFTGTMASVLGQGDSEVISINGDIPTPCAQDDVVLVILPSAADCLCDTLQELIPVTLLGTLPDTDGDGVANQFDLDDDNDGIPDLDESPSDPLADNDNDGVPAYLDDNDGNASIGNDDGLTESAFDFDGDNVPNHIDLDSDNDGIFDVVEAGHLEDDLDNDGRIDGAPSVFGDNGLFNDLETTSESGIINYVVADSNSDGVIDATALDSDSDGCNDVIEAGYGDADNNGLLGSGN